LAQAAALARCDRDTGAPSHDSAESLLVREPGRGVVEHGPDELGLFGMQDGLDLDHAVLGIAPAQVAALLVGEWLYANAWSR
jgi:hypothetical protein